MIFNFLKIKHKFAFLFLIVILFLPTVAQGASRYWVGSAGGNWNDTANWAASAGTCGTGGGQTVPGTSDIAYFVANCTNGATMNANVSVLGMNIASGYTGTVSPTGAVSITVADSGFTQAGGTFTGGTGTLTFYTMTLSGGTFTSTSGNLNGNTLGLTFNRTGGTFNHNNGTIKFQFSGTITPGSNLTLNNVIIDNNGSSMMGAGAIITIAGSFNVAGNFTIQDSSSCGFGGCDNILNGINSPTVTVQGNLSIPSVAGSGTLAIANTVAFATAGNFSFGDSKITLSSNLTFNGTGNQTITHSAGTISAGTWTVNRPSETAGTAVKLGASSALRAIAVTAGTFDVAGYNYTNTATVSSGATLKLQGGETVNTPTLNAGSTVQYYGTAGPYNLKGWTYSNIRFSSASATTYNLIAGGLSVKNLTIDANNTLDATASNYNTTLTGNWSNSGTFTQRAGTVTFSGTSQKVFGNTTFYNFTKDVSAGSADTMMFENTKTQTIAQSGTLTLKGALGKILTLRSCDSSGTQSDGTQWLLTVNATGTTLAVDYVDVKDSNASGGKEIANTNTTDSLNNLNWAGFASGNSAPTATSASVSPSSVAVGATLTFTGNWTESDAGDQDKIYICKDSACTNCDNTAQSNCWCYSSSYVTEPTVTGTCTYTAQSADTGNRNFWLKVCDDAPSCSSSVYGGSFSVGPSASSAFKVRGLESFRIKGGNDSKSFRIKCL